jgi:hypothetical protein
MKSLIVFVVGLAFLAGLGVACEEDSSNGDAGGSTPAETGTGETPPAEASIDPADFQATVDNRFFPLVVGSQQVLEGSETDADTGETVELRVESTVLDEEYEVAGVPVTVVLVREFENGDLVEETRDYYAQHVDGTVSYFGEDVDDYEDGEIVGHSGAWLAGEGDALPGIFMPADPQVGDQFEQERAPGVAEDESEVIAVDQAVETPAGAFEGCIRTEDYAPLDDVTEFKYYCPDVGLVVEQNDEGVTIFELISSLAPMN